MASMEEINGQLNIAKVNFERGAELSLKAEDSASAVAGIIETMWDAVRTLQRTDLVRPVEELKSTVATARDANLFGVTVLQETFGVFSAEDNNGLDPHIQKALQRGNGARLHLTEGVEADGQGSIGLNEVEGRTERIRHHLTALLEELSAVRGQVRVSTTQIEKSTHGSLVAGGAIVDYQQQNGLQ